MHRPPKETLMFAGLFGWEAGKNHAFNGVSITSLNVNLLTRAQKALSGLRRRGFRGYCALKGAFFRFNLRLNLKNASPVSTFVNSRRNRKVFLPASYKIVFLAIAQIPTRSFSIFSAASRKVFR